MQRLLAQIVLTGVAAFAMAATGVAVGQEGEAAPRTLLEPREVFGDEAAESLESEMEEDDEIETDRDSFTPATTVVRRGRVIVESSYSFIDNRDGAESHSFPELLTRVGIFQNVELRLGANYEIGGGGSVSNSGSFSEEESLGSGAEDEATLLYGVKVLLTDQDRWIPQSSLIVQANTPTAGPDSSTQITTGYVFGWTLPNKWTIDSALRYADTTEEGDHFNLFAPSTVVKIPLGEKYKAHIEYFGMFTDNRESERDTQFISPGIHYLVTRDLEIGVRVGWGLTDDSAKFFSNVGAGLRF